MSFFKLSTGTEATSTTTFELSGGGSSTPIPAGSILLAVITEAKWDNYDGSDYVSIRWDVVGKEYTKRVIFQKIKVEEADDKRRDKAIMMLMAIDANTGGFLAKSGEKPTNDSLQNLCNKQVGIMVDVWELEVEGQMKSGNWVKMVATAKDAGAMLKERGGNPKAEEVKKVAPKMTQAKPTTLDFEEEDMPF